MMRWDDGRMKWNDEIEWWSKWWNKWRWWMKWWTENDGIKVYWNSEREMMKYMDNGGKIKWWDEMMKLNDELKWWNKGKCNDALKLTSWSQWWG